MTKDDATNAVASGALWGLGAAVVGLIVGGWAERRKTRREDERAIERLLERLEADGYRLVKEDA